MRKIANYILLLGVLLLAPSCDSFLDITPVGKVIPTTYDEYRALMTQAYTYMPKNGGTRTAFRSDEVKGFTNTIDRANFFEEWSWNDNDPEYTSSFGWRLYYQALFIANYVIEKEEDIIEGSDVEIKQLVGEAYALRGYIHFVLVNLYGEHYAPETLNAKAIPLKLNTNTEETLPRNSVGEVYQSIVQDIASAEKRMVQERWDVGYNYRFGRVALEAFKVRLHLYTNNWSEVLNVATPLIEETIELQDISKSSGYPNKFDGVESILALEYFTNDMTRAIYISSDLYTLYASTDRRRAIFYKSEGSGRYTVRKGGSNEFSSTFRSAEIYLSAAEAACQLNNLEGAQEWLLQLKAKRYSTAGYPAEESRVLALNQTELLQEIYDERYRELAFEGHRWFDLRRTTQPALTKSESGVEFQLNERDSRYTIRIPSEAIESNPNLSN